MRANCKNSAGDVQHIGFLGMATSLAVVGSALGLLAALLLGGSSGVGSLAADRPVSPDCGLGLIFAGGQQHQPGRP